MSKSKPPLFRLFKSTFFLSAFTFGGGYVIVPLMKKKFVDGLGWLEEEDMLNIVAIAQSSPGVMAINASILVGWRIAGLAGALVAILGTALPPLLIISVVSFFYDAFRDSAEVNAFLKATSAGVCAVIFDVVLNMGKDVLKAKKRLPPLLMAGSFLLYFVFHVNIMLIILFCGTFGALLGFYDTNPN
jgi:chromate transporter